MSFASRYRGIGFCMYLTRCESEEFLVSVFLSKKRNKIVGQVSLGVFCI